MFFLSCAIQSSQCLAQFVHSEYTQQLQHSSCVIFSILRRFSTFPLQNPSFKVPILQLFESSLTFSHGKKSPSALTNNLVIPGIHGPLL